jgi:predicted DCC family thiol-disulfide oxidoreductase YuxK
MEDHYIIIFDGVCNFCNGSVNFIIARDPREKFLFSPVQSEFSKALLIRHGLQGIGDDSFVLIKNGKYYLRSDAALEISRDLSGFWRFFYGLRVLPRPLRDIFYNLIARNRYKLFGKRDSCMMPTPELKRRFILDQEQGGF